MAIELEKPKRKAPVKKILSSILPASTSQESIVIDYPKDGDKFLPHHYAVRIGASGGSGVEIAVDGGDWKHCRHTAGYYWYDWHQIPVGKHKLVVRMKTADGKIKKSKIVNCEAVKA